MENERIVRLQKNWEARQDLVENLKIKDEKIKTKRNELDYERRLLQQHDETLKKKEEDLKKTKLQDEKIQKEFLQVSEKTIFLEFPHKLQFLYNVNFFESAKLNNVRGMKIFAVNEKFILIN